MDYRQIDSIMQKCHINNDPAFEKLNIAISDIPDEFRDGYVLGLYYPDAMIQTLGGVKISVPSRTAVIPPYANEDTLLHELGHAHHDFYRGDISEPSANKFMLQHRVAKRVVKRSAVPYTQQGTYTNIYEIIAPSIMTPGVNVPVKVHVQNIFNGALHMYCVGLYDTNRFIDWQEVTVNPGDAGEFAGSFTMPDHSTVVRIQMFYDAIAEDGSVYQQQDSERLVTVNAQGQFVVPEGFDLQTYTLYPAAAWYNGDATFGAFGFTAPLTILPGVSWLVEQMLAQYVSRCLQNGATPLWLKIYTRPGMLGSTDYIIECAAFSSAAGFRGPSKLAVIALAAIIGGILVAIGVLVVLETKFLNEGKYGPQVTTTTKTEASQQTLNPNQSFGNPGGTVTVTDGGDGKTVATTSSGQKITFTPGQAINIPAGSTVVAGAKGASVNIPASISTYTGPSNPSGAGSNPVTDTVKWVAIGAVAIGVTLLGLALVQGFGKRELYPLRA
jgi:hypothetical protein